MMLKCSEFFMVKVILAGLSLCCPAFTVERVHAAENKDITDAGDILQIVLPLTAWGSTFLVRGPDGKRWDREGTAQATKAIGSALGTMGVGKYIVNKARPNESNRYSYPSGHTTAAFAGADSSIRVTVTSGGFPLCSRPVLSATAASRRVPTSQTMLLQG